MKWSGSQPSLDNERSNAVIFRKDRKDSPKPTRKSFLDEMLSIGSDSDKTDQKSKNMGIKNIAKGFRKVKFPQTSFQRRLMMTLKNKKVNDSQTKGSYDDDYDDTASQHSDIARSVHSADGDGCSNYLKGNTKYGREHRYHHRSVSDTTAIVRGVPRGECGLDSVQELKESPSSSSASPNKEQFTMSEYLLANRQEDPPVVDNTQRSVVHRRSLLMTVPTQPKLTHQLRVAVSDTDLLETLDQHQVSLGDCHLIPCPIYLTTSSEDSFSSDFSEANSPVKGNEPLFPVPFDLDLSGSSLSINSQPSPQEVGNKENLWPQLEGDILTRSKKKLQVLGECKCASLPCVCFPNQDQSSHSDRKDISDTVHDFNNLCLNYENSQSLSVSNMDMVLTNNNNNNNYNGKCNNNNSNETNIAATKDCPKLHKSKTAFSITHAINQKSQHDPFPNRLPFPEEVMEKPGSPHTYQTPTKLSQSPAKIGIVPCIHRRSSDSDLSITPKGK